MSDQDDERWITERDNEPGASFRTCMRAAIARGYERGRGEARDEIGNVVAILDEAGVECEDEIGERTLAGRVAALHRDRDRLAKRCEEEEADIAAADEFLRSTAWESPAGAATIAARVRLAYEAGVTDGAHNEAMVERANASRLAALEQRVGGIIEALLGCFGPDGAESYGDMARRLAALRAPGEATLPPEVARLQVVVGTLTNERDRAELALATARRERDEAVGVVRDLDSWASTTTPPMHEIVARARARALVAGQGVAASTARNGVMKSPEERVVELEAALGDVRLERDASNEAYRVADQQLAARDAEIAGLKAKLAGAEHAIADLTTTFGTVESERDTLRARVAELEARDREGRWLLDAPGIVAPPIHEWADRRDAYLSAAPIPDPARGLIERCLDALDGRAMALRADLRAYLGGG